MPQQNERRWRQVFISFAGEDRETASSCKAVFLRHGIDTFMDTDIVPGQNVLLAISNALDRSDYCVLLWSKACDDRWWVQTEWSSALSIEWSRGRLFLFIVRLDQTQLPALLAPRSYLDAFDNGDGRTREQRVSLVLQRLVRAWNRDRALDVPVFPAPRPPAEDSPLWNSPAVEVYIRNLALSVAHTVLVPPVVTGQELASLVRAELALPDVESEFDGLVGLRFSYQLLTSHGSPVLEDAGTRLRISDGTEFDLQVLIEPFGPGGPMGSPMILRNGPGPDDSPMSPESILGEDDIRSLASSAFEHLMPRK